MSGSEGKSVDKVSAFLWEYTVRLPCRSFPLLVSDQVYAKIQRLKSLIYIQSINKPNFANWSPSIYLNELEIKEATEKTSSVSIVYLKSHKLIAQRLLNYVTFKYFGLKRAWWRLFQTFPVIRVLSPFLSCVFVFFVWYVFAICFHLMFLLVRFLQEITLHPGMCSISYVSLSTSTI